MSRYMIVKIDNNISQNIRDKKIMEGDLEHLTTIAEILNQENDIKDFKYVVWDIETVLYNGPYHNLGTKTPEELFEEDKRSMNIIGCEFEHDLNQKEISILNKMLGV